MGEWRTWLTELVLMEPTIRRAMESLEPLTALGNLRRVSPDELRQAARAVREHREQEIARQQSNQAEIANAGDVDEINR